MLQGSKGIEADGSNLLNDRIQNLIITVDKIKYCMNKITSLHTAYKNNSQGAKSPTRKQSTTTRGKAPLASSDTMEEEEATKNEEGDTTKQESEEIIDLQKVPRDIPSLENKPSEMDEENSDKEVKEENPTTESPQKSDIMEEEPTPPVRAVRKGSRTAAKSNGFARYHTSEDIGNDKPRANALSLPLDVLTGPPLRILTVSEVN